MSELNNLTDIVLGIANRGTIQLYEEEAKEVAQAVAVQVLRDHAANLRFIANRSRQDEAIGLDEAADITIATAEGIEHYAD